MATRMSLVGKKFGRLTALKEVDRDRHDQRMWLCRCDCDVEKVVGQNQLRSGKTQSCGCLQKDTMRAIRTTHGDTVGAKPCAEYRAWRGMLSRCTLPNHPKYPSYGGRGIRVDDRWARSYESFLEDMGRRPSPQHSVDRKDVNGHYEPGNCQWATAKTQGRNRRITVKVTWAGEEMAMTDLAERQGVSYLSLYGRVVRNGASPEAAVEALLLAKQKAA